MHLKEWKILMETITGKIEEIRTHTHIIPPPATKVTITNSHWY